MIINNTSVPGIYKYTEGLEVERGDFVTFGENLYICVPENGVTYKIEDDSVMDYKNFKTYLGGEKAEWEDFEKIFAGIGTSDLKDGLVTSPILSQAIKRLMFGIDSNGIITEEIISNLSYVSPGLKEFIKGHKLTPSSALNYLLEDTEHPEFNNLCIKISRSIVKNYLPGIEEINNDTTGDSVILKNYTYRESKTKYNYPIRVRVQEIIDHINGVCLYRYIKLLDVTPSSVVTEFGGDDAIGKPSSWKLSTINLEYLSRLDAVLKYISDKENSSSEGNKGFNFKKISIPNAKVSNSEEGYKTYQFSFNPQYIESFEDITVTISSSKQGETGLCRNYSMTVNLKDETCTYYFQNNVSIKRLSSLGNSLVIELVTPENLDTKITSIYIKNYEL